MIFRRRRTRIEIEQTTVRLAADDLRSVVLRPVAVTPTAPSVNESTVALPLPHSAKSSTAHAFDKETNS